MMYGLLVLLDCLLLVCIDDVVNAARRISLRWLEKV